MEGPRFGKRMGDADRGTGWACRAVPAGGPKRSGPGCIDWVRLASARHVRSKTEMPSDADAARFLKEAGLHALDQIKVPGAAEGGVPRVDL